MKNKKNEKIYEEKLPEFDEDYINEESIDSKEDDVYTVMDEDDRLSIKLGQEILEELAKEEALTEEELKIEKKKKILTKIIILLIFFVAVIFLSFFLKQKIFTVAVVPTSSMENTIKTREYILGTNIHDTASLKRGDIIVFYSKEAKTYLVKRIIGIPNDVVTIVDNKVYLNNAEYNEPYINSSNEKWNLTRVVNQYEVPADGYFVMGDNRLYSEDSRYWGYVSKADVVAKVRLIIYPLPSIRILR